jgi:putative ABC transport system permease protein
VRVLWAKAPLVLVRHPAVLLAVVSAAALVGLAAASAPFVRAAVESESLNSQLQSMTPLAAGVEISTGGLLAHDGVRRADAPSLVTGLPFLGSPVLESETVLTAPGIAGSSSALLLMARTGAVAHVSHLAGGAGRGVWISSATAKAASLGPGGTLTLVPPSEGPGKPPRPIRLRVAGVYRALDGDLSNPYWQNYIQAIRPVDPNDPLPPPFVLASYATFRQALAGTEQQTFVGNHFEFPVDPGRLTVAGARDLERRIGVVRRRLAARSGSLTIVNGKAVVHGGPFLCPRPTSCTITSSLTAALTVATGDVAAVSPTVSLLADCGILIGLLTAVAAGVFLVRRRAGEAQLFYARGESTASFAARTAIEALLPTALGVAAGVGAALLALRFFAPAGSLDHGTVLAGTGHAAAAAGGALVAFAAGAAAAYPRRSDRAHPWLRLVRRLPWELAPLLAAAALLASVLSGGGLSRAADGSTHPSLAIFLLPVLVVAGLAGLAVRGARALVGRRGGGAPPAVFLAVRRVGAARGLLVAVVVTAAIALGAFAYATTLSSSLARGAAKKAYVANGSDVQGVVDPRERITSLLPFPAVIVQVDTMEVSLGGTSTGSGGPVDLLAADPAALGRTIVWGSGWGDDPRALLPRLEHDSGPSLAALATRDTPAADEIVDQGARIPIRIVGRVNAFPGTTAGRPALIVSRDALRRAAVRAHIANPGPTAGGLIWAKGDPAMIERALRASNLAAVYLTRADHLSRSPSVVATTRTYGFFRTIGTAAAILSLLALLLYLQARQRSQLIASAMARRMGLRLLADAAALALEAAAVVFAAGLVGVAAAVVTARPLVHHVDPLPHYAPASSLIVPWTTLVFALAAATVVAAAVGAGAAALASRSDVAEALRVA